MYMFVSDLPISSRAGITEINNPKNVQGVRSFLGLANFYQHFIQDDAKVARPLNDLTKKDKPFVWKEAQQEAFDKLKMLFTTAPVLAFSDNDCQFRLESDASEFTMGAVLSMLKEDKWHPVAYNSHSMSPEKRNYPIVDKEMVSVIRATEVWRFKVWNNHANLQWFMKRQDLNRRQAHWAQWLSRFNFKWIHKPGASMAKSNALSQQEDHAETTQQSKLMPQAIH